MATSNHNTARKPIVAAENSGNLITAYTAQLITSGGSGSPINITAPLPANYQLGLSTNYDNPFNSPLSSMIGGKTGQIAQSVEPIANAATGATSRNKWLSISTWTGGNAFQLTVPFVIVAETDAATEVVKRMRDLLKLAAPSEDGAGMLTAPGPNVRKVTSASEENTGELITLRLGDFFKMSPCILESVTCDFDTQMEDESRCPMSVTITVGIKSYFVVTRQDLDIYFSSKVQA